MKLIDQNRFDEITKNFSTIGPLLVVGDLGIDKYTYGDVARISPEAPVPVLEVSKEWMKLGLAANISHNLQTLGVESILCGVIGEDQKAKDFEALLEDCGLKTWGLTRAAERPTTFKERITTSRQQICRVDYEDSSDISPKTGEKLLSKIADFKNDSKAIIIEDYSKGTLTADNLPKIMAIGKEAGHLVAVDPGRKTDPLLYKGCTLLKPNLVESKLMVEYLGYTYQDKNLSETAEILLDKLDLEKIVITLGPEGMALLERNSKKGLTTIPTAALEVFDVSGAGDTIITLMTASLMAGATLEEAAWISNCGAGVVVAKSGTATVDLIELNGFYKRMKSLLNE
ncbi:MAG: D-glycero-beta-D-manno-heptose-7-phosphate kinase [Halobacteriovoraceae bacterium]|nr:D-glycero-beta-D-manno-heptose-7-phosphate kinase [Halobacteriovoraceae bacterium]